MGAQRQPERHAAQTTKVGHAMSQSVVELVGVSHSGLVFWSRHHLEITAELQLRLHRGALQGAIWAAGLKSCDDWLQLRGFVVQCQPSRRQDGTVGFQIAVIFDQAILQAENASTCCPQSSRPRSGCFGLN